MTLKSRGFSTRVSLSTATSPSSSRWVTCTTLQKRVNNDLNGSMLRAAAAATLYHEYAPKLKDSRPQTPAHRPSQGTSYGATIPFGRTSNRQRSELLPLPVCIEFHRPLIQRLRVTRRRIARGTQPQRI